MVYSYRIGMDEIFGAGVGWTVPSREIFRRLELLKIIFFNKMPDLILKCGALI